jgi:subtilisin family serine protease
LAATTVALFGLSACFAPPPPADPCQNASSASSQATVRGRADQPLSPNEARDQARLAAAASNVRTKSGEIPLVTVEKALTGPPKIAQTPVDNPDHAGQVAEQKAAGGELVSVDVDHPVHALAASNDPLRSQQWALDQVPYEQAWSTDATTGTGVIVGVVDTGSTATHPDLVGQVLPGQYFLSGANPPQGSGASDDNGHGTHVSGIIAAASNNLTGIAGAAPGAKILPVKALDSAGSGFDSDVANGIDWAVDHGAKVINLSLGGSSPSTADLNALKYAQTHDVLVLAAAGNNGQNGNTPSYPAAYSQSTDGAEVIAVAALTNNKTRAAYSTCASYVDVSAPGGSGSGDSSSQVLSTWNDGSYKAISGTSMATPYASAAAALVRAAHPTFTANDTRNRLISTATHLGAPGVNPQYGAGEVNPLPAAGP